MGTLAAYGPVMQQLVARPEAVAQSLTARRGLFFSALLQVIEVSCMHSSVKVQPLSQAALCSTFCVIQVSPGFICGFDSGGLLRAPHGPLGDCEVLKSSAAHHRADSW